MADRPPGESRLQQLLASVSPALSDEEYVFCSFANARYGDHAGLEPLAAMQEQEGLTLVLPRTRADAAGHAYAAVFRCITLGVHSSLTAVGLTAAFSRALASREISANVVSGYYHDHILVPAHRAGDAMAAIRALSGPAVVETRPVGPDGPG